MTQCVSDLQSLANQWGNAFSKSHGTTCKWVDLHAKDRQMSPYQQYKIEAQVTNVRYESSGTAIDMPGIVVSDTTTNDSSVQQESVFKRTESLTSSFTWTMKEAIKVGLNLSAQVEIPPVVAKANLNAEISFEAAESSTKTETQTWEIDQPIHIPARSKMDMIWTIIEKQSLATFCGDIILTGYFAIWNNDKIDIHKGADKHYLWFIPVVNAFRQMKDFGITVPSQYNIGYNSVTYKASGECKGNSGFNTTFSLKQSPLTAPSSQEITKKGVPGT